MLKKFLEGIMQIIGECMEDFEQLLNYIIRKKVKLVIDRFISKYEKWHILEKENAATSSFSLLYLTLNLLLA